MISELILEGPTKEKYLESLIVAIENLNGFLEKEDSEYNKTKIFFNEQVADIYNFLKLVSLENKLAGGSKDKLAYNQSNGLPAFNEMNTVGYKYTQSKDQLVAIVREQIGAARIEEDKKLDTKNYLEALSMNAVKSMLQGSPADSQRISLRQFLENTRLQTISKEQTPDAEFKRKIFDEKLVSKTRKIEQLDEKKALYEIEIYKVSRTNHSWVQYTIQFEYEHPKWWSKLEENKDGSWGPKDELASAIKDAGVFEISPNQLYLKMLKIKGVQPTYASVHTLGPFYHASGLKHLDLSELFLKRPDAFALQYSRESVGLEDEWDVKNIPGKKGYKRYPDRIVITCPSEVGIDFKKMIGNENTNVDIVEVKQTIIDKINKQYAKVNPRWASEYKL